MFGHDDHKKDDDASNGDQKPDDTSHSFLAVDANNPDDKPDGQAGKDWQHPGTPLDDNSDGGDDKAPADNPAPAIVEPSASHAEPEDEGEDKEPRSPFHSDFTPAKTLSSSDGSGDSTDALIDIKQEALTKLSPLVGHLDQTPDEKFRTLMMMIQASDDQSLVKSAYDAALEIEDEKTRAQALLDIVNEINYFTQHTSKPE